jgi:uncharacterized protein (DUF486 family)
MPPLLARLLPPLMLVASNLFMTTAWYGHLKYKDRALWLVVLVSWGIASSNIGWRCRPTGWAATSIPLPS